MQKRLRVFLLVLLAVWSAAVVAQEPTRGTWSAHLSSISTDQGGNKLVQLEMRTERGHSEMSHTFTLADRKSVV